MLCVYWSPAEMSLPFGFVKQGKSLLGFFMGRCLCDYLFLENTIYFCKTKQTDVGFHSVLVFWFCFLWKCSSFWLVFFFTVLVTPGEKITSCYVPADHWQDHLLFGFVKQSKSLLGFWMTRWLCVYHFFIFRKMLYM